MANILGVLGGAAGYYFGGVPGALLGSSIGGGIDTNEARKDAAQSANEFSAQQYATRYQTQVKDLQAAGLNPMLAYSQGPGVSPTGQQYQSSNPYENVSKDYASAYNVQREGERIESDTRLKDAQKDSQESMSKLNDAQRELVNETVSKVKEEIANLKSDNARIKALTDTIIEQKNLYYAQGLTTRSQGDMYRATADKLKAEIPYMSSKQFLADAQKALVEVESKLKGLDLESAQKFDNFGRDANQLRPVLEVLKALVRPR